MTFRRATLFAAVAGQIEGEHAFVIGRTVEAKPCLADVRFAIARIVAIAR
jgi:hypothetical protein